MEMGAWEGTGRKSFQFHLRPHRLHVSVTLKDLKKKKTKRSIMLRLYITTRFQETKRNKALEERRETGRKIFVVSQIQNMKGTKVIFSSEKLKNTCFGNKLGKVKQ